MLPPATIPPPKRVNAAITMPGSLFPRSASVAPSVVPDTQYQQDVEQSPPRRRQLQHAVDRFNDRDANPSLLLPNVAYSPTGPRTLSAKARGKQRQIDEEDEHDVELEDDDVATRVLQLEDEREERRRWAQHVADADISIDEEERRRDKERIRILEEEISSLRAEVLKQSS